MAFITVRAIPGNVSKKGEVVSLRDDAVFGLKARLPRVLRIEVTGATAAEIDQFLGRLISAVSYSIVFENSAGWRVRMELDQSIIAVTGMDNSFKQSIKSYILDDLHEDKWTATQFSQSPTQLTVDIAKGQTFDLLQIKQDVNTEFKDKLQKVLHFQRYFFPDVIVDPRVTQGLINEEANEDGEGNLPENWTHDTITKAQALAAIVDRLA